MAGDPLASTPNTIGPKIRSKRKRSAAEGIPGSANGATRDKRRVARGAVLERRVRLAPKSGAGGFDSLDDFRLSQKQLSVHFAASPRAAVPLVLGVRWDVAGILSAQH